MGNRDLLEVLYRASEGDGDPSPARWYQVHRRNSGAGEIRKRRRTWLLIGAFAAAVLTAMMHAR